MSSNHQRKAKKHKIEKRTPEKQCGLKLILKVTSPSTTEHSLSNYQDSELLTNNDCIYEISKSHKKKAKKKAKKKKDGEKKHKHRHKSKRRKLEENEVEVECSSQQSPYPVLGSPSQHREPRSCVLKKIQEKSPLQKMLEHLLALLEKKDPQNFFAWPVTDNIAPGYSTIITQPMDFSTVRQKIEDNLYSNLSDFIEDFKLICANAMQYNRIDTIYYKSSKKLLQSGMKLMLPEKLGWLLELIPELTSDDVGFEITPELRQYKEREENDEAEHVHERRKSVRSESAPEEVIPEDVLVRSQNAAKEARRKLVIKKGVPVGFVKQRKDGTTNLNILVGGDGVIPGTKKRSILLGDLVGKLTEGTGQVQGFREDRRNVAKPIKPLYYGPFGSHTPSYDSGFANLTKEESDLIFQTFSSDSTPKYCESVLELYKDSDYDTHFVDNLLEALNSYDNNRPDKEENEIIEISDDYVSPQPLETVKVNVGELKSLQKLGINMKFLEGMEEQIRLSEEKHELQERLNHMCQLLERLHQTQNDRLSSPLPSHLNQCCQIGEEEMQIAEEVCSNLADVAKRVPPKDIISVAGIRKALGVAIPTKDDEMRNVELELQQFFDFESTFANVFPEGKNLIEEMEVD